MSSHSPLQNEEYQLFSFLTRLLLHHHKLFDRPSLYLLCFYCLLLERWKTELAAPNTGCTTALYGDRMSPLICTQYFPCICFLFGLGFWRFFCCHRTLGSWFQRIESNHSKMSPKFRSSAPLFWVLRHVGRDQIIFHKIMLIYSKTCDAKSVNITQKSINFNPKIPLFILFSSSLMKILNVIGPKTSSWGTLLPILCFFMENAH